MYAEVREEFIGNVGSNPNTKLKSWICWPEHIKEIMSKTSRIEGECINECYLSPQQLAFLLAFLAETGIFPVHEITLKVFGSFRELEIYRVPGSGLLTAM